MRSLNRPALSARAQEMLARRTEYIVRAQDPLRAARESWKKRRAAAFQDIRHSLLQMARGRERCMYCEDSAGTDIEHFYPKAIYPERTFDWTNYLWACSSCNSNFKRAQFPLDGTQQPLLIDPATDDPTQHLTLSFSTGRFVAETPRGEASIEVFGLQREILVSGRRHAWIVLGAVLPRYCDVRDNGEHERAREFIEVVEKASFGGVLAFALSAMERPNARAVLGDQFVESVAACPEVLGW